MNVVTTVGAAAVATVAPAVSKAKLLTILYCVDGLPPVSPVRVAPTTGVVLATKFKPNCSPPTALATAVPPLAVIVSDEGLVNVELAIYEIAYPLVAFEAAVIVWLHEPVVEADNVPKLQVVESTVNVRVGLTVALTTTPSVNTKVD